MLKSLFSVFGTVVGSISASASPIQRRLMGRRGPHIENRPRNTVFLCSELGVVVEQPDDGPGDMFVYVFLIPAGPPTVIVNNISDTISLDV
jgi:hypothetical protein